MNNLVEQASQWLQSEACRSGNILERTIAVIACFRKYVVEEKTESNPPYERKVISI